MVQQQRRRIVLIAVGLGLLTFAIVFWVLTKTQGKSPLVTTPGAQAAEQTVGTILVATRDIPVRETLDAGMIAEQQMPMTARPGDALTSLDEAVGLVTTVPIKSGEVLTKPKVVNAGYGTGLVFTIPEGHRALTLRVDDVSGVGGFVKPGDYVDVIGTREVDGGVITETVMQDVPVLATGAQTVPGQKPEDPPQVVPNVTVAVTPEAAEQLTLTEHTGGYKLTLRPHGEHWFVPTAPTRRATGSGARSAAPQPATGRPNPAAPTGAMMQPPAAAKPAPKPAAQWTPEPVALLGYIAGAEGRVACVRYQGRVLIIRVGDHLTAEEVVSEIGQGYLVLVGPHGERVIRQGSDH